jgi:hypothetical protein
VKILPTGQPNLLCVPSWKSLTGPPGTTPKTPPGLNHFTCYPVTRTPIISPVFDENQFGTRKVAISQTRWLCVPSTKKVIG